MYYMSSIYLYQYLLIIVRIESDIDCMHISLKKLNSIFKDHSNLKVTVILRQTLMTNIESFIIPSNLTEIGEETFTSCNKLQKVEFHSNSELQIKSKKEGPVGIEPTTLGSAIQCSTIELQPILFLYK